MGNVFFVGFLVDFSKQTETKELNKDKQLSMWVFHSTFVFLGKILWVRKRRSILMYIFGRSNPKWIIFHLPSTMESEWSKKHLRRFCIYRSWRENLDICSDSLGKTLSWPREFLLHQKLATCITCSAFGTYRPWKLTACRPSKIDGTGRQQKASLLKWFPMLSFSGGKLAVNFWEG